MTAGRSQKNLAPAVDGPKIDPRYIINSPCPGGALLEAFAKWGRGGARGCASQAPPGRSRPSCPPALQTGCLENGWTWRERRRAKARRIREALNCFPCVPPGSTAPGTEIAANGAPRGERVFADAPAPRKARTKWWRLAALHPLAFCGGQFPRAPWARGKERKVFPGLRQRAGAMTLAWLARRLVRRAGSTAKVHRRPHMQIMR